MNLVSVAMFLMLLLADGPLHFRAHILSLANHRIAMETSDGNVFTAFPRPVTRFLESKKKVALSDLHVGDIIDVDIWQDHVGALMLVEVRLIQRRNLETLDALPSLKHRTAQDPEPGPLVLPEIRRDLIVPERTHRLPVQDDLIGRASDAAQEFSEILPNYICKQVTTRFSSPTRPVHWREKDEITAEIVYEDSRESYRNIALNGRVLAGAKMLGLGGGTSSIGEFGTMLRDLFHPETKTHFQFQHESVISAVTTAIYEFAVEQPNSQWRLMAEEQSAKPAYKGEIWMDKGNARALRMEMEAVDLPETFRLSSAELAVDYGYVDLGTERALLPARAEIIVCYRGTPACDRNVIEWRDYHRFLGESKLIVGKPEK